MSQYWLCDRCGGKITKSEDGWVEWIVAADGAGKVGRDLRLVHHLPASPLGKPDGCQHNEQAAYGRDKGIVADLSLDAFLDSNGLMRLLAMISENELPKEEVLEIIKRLFIPGYEVARHHFGRARHEGVIEPDMPDNYYFDYQIEATLQFAEEHMELRR